jgi:predicted aldo/keto reductase-like oxidoreductase
MKPPPNDLSRRDFLKTAAACGAGSVLAGAGRLALGQSAATTRSAELAASQPASDAAAQAVPRRPFGKTGLDVSILTLGGIFDITANQLVLKQALKWGIDYWDTAASYTGGKSELGIGMFFQAHPQDRKKVFLVTKSKDGPEMMDSLQKSLERMKTDYVDMFFVHGVGGGEEVARRAEDWKAFAEQAKAAQKTRFFGFSTHSNMASCLQAASKLGFIDGIMLAYNFRTMNQNDTQAAVEAAHEARIGLTAMKTQAKKARGGGEAELQLLDQFTQKGFSVEQAALKAVWEDQRISTICSAMYNLPVLQSNYLAAIDKAQLTSADRRALQEYARGSYSQYCAGCSAICQQAVAGSPPIADVMRWLMYRDEYGMADYARQLFAELSPAARAALVHADYSTAERRCPQRMAIGELMRQAGETLA